MSLISGLLQGAQAPPKQDAASTIQTLCLRLSSATLLEDRRAAILGLRSFARDYQELVASEGLRELIATLSRDREDLDTAKAVLETLLTLFVRDEANPESSEDIALWLTDEFTQKQENITILLDLLEDADFYIRLYTIQLLAAISQNRPARTQECVFTAPLGVTRLVSILDDKRDAIRNEAVLLIIHLSAGHTDIQKLITFQGTLDQVFSIIDMEGGVDGGIVVQDCLQLLSNLLSFNVSNQNYFRETGCVSKLAKLLTLSEDEVPPFAKEQRDTNIQYALRLVRLFVVPGGLGTATNQNALVAAGLLHLVITVAFLSSCEMTVRAEALKAIADLIDGNESLQHSFAQIQVALPHLQPQSNGEDAEEENGEAHCGVIEALLDLALWDSSIHSFDARLAACRCLEAYFNGNSPVRTFFLKHAIQLYAEGDESPNAVSCLLNLDSASRGDPYRVWIASVILIHLIFNDTGAKVMATEMREGDAEAGEEEVTAIQGISANLITALQHQYDPRICIGYLMLLCIWLYEDSDAVDDFLSETSSVQTLVSAVKENGVDPIVQGLSTFLLGILYEFSHQKSPVTRSHLHQLLATQMTRDLYVNKITLLRSHPLIRDFEVSKDDFMPGHRRRKHGLPEVYFDQVFIEFLKENYGAVMRAIDKAPELETRVSGNGVVKTSNGVNLEELQSLRAQLSEKAEILERIEGERERERQAMEQQHSTTLERIERERLNEREAMEQQHSSALAEIEKARRTMEQQLANAQSSSKLAELQGDLQKAAADNEAQLTKVSQDVETRDQRIAELSKTIETAAKEHTQDLQTAHEEYTAELESKTTLVDKLQKKLDILQKQLAEAEVKGVDEKLAAVISEKEEARKKADEVQAELDDLFMVLGDLEEKRKQDKKWLKELGAEVSDDEDDDGDNDDEDEDEE
ncbi:p115 like vesicle tethering protein [Trichophaea hybrida]|nr:p115 like vesicle tethering protein [Trichophaea hybrida]